jgi:hypothetical protein
VDSSPTSGSASGVFAFAGAGLSLSMPSGLPLFWMLRDEILAQLGLFDYLSAVHRGSSLTGAQLVAEGLAPEPFMQALRQAGASVDRWLAQALTGGGPNAGHAAFAGLAAAGAHAWTVNYDTLIEQAGGSALDVSAWPDAPGRRGLLKPHGTAGGPLIASSDQVLRPLAGPWRDRLEADLAGSHTVVFIGYSGRDLDFQPLWHELLGGKRVLWFDRPHRPGRTEPPDQARRRQILGRQPDDSTLEFLPAWGAAGAANPTSAFVSWAARPGAGSADPVLVRRLDDPVPPRRFPTLTDRPAAARAAALSILGDPRSALRLHARRALAGPDRRTAAKQGLVVALNHGGSRTGAALAASAALPPSVLRDGLARKRASILFNQGRHDDVLRLTRDATAPAMVVLRSGSVRMTGPLDNAADLAAQALQGALGQGHPVLAANASLQLCYALMWAGRLDEARRAHDERLLPYAGLAATRWMSWAGVIDASLRLHALADTAQPDETALRPALDALALADGRFASEGLVDGRISALTVRLTACRIVGDTAGYRNVRTTLATLTSPRAGGTHYSRGHPFAAEAIAIEDGQLEARHDDKREHGLALLRQAARSKYPVHRAVAHIALASALTGPDRRRHAALARDTAVAIQARRIVAIANRLAAADTESAQVYFP